MGIRFCEKFELNLYQNINPTNSRFLKYLKVILIILILKVPLESQGQSIAPVLASAWSMDVNQNGIQYSFSLGEGAVSTLENDKILTQGFLQPENFIRCTNFTLIGYPNPTTGLLNFKFDGCDDQVGRVMLMDVYGKIILNFDVAEDKIDLSELQAGIYILKAYNLSGIDVGTIKIAKVSKL